MAWELLTEKVGFDGDRLWITVHTSDDEAEAIWHEQIGVPMDRIQRLGDKENFWEMGNTGPCGPCSEIHYRLRPRVGRRGRPGTRRRRPLRRVLEPRVHAEPARAEDGSVSDLARKNIDTGGGIERWLMLLQNVPTVFDTDELRRIIAEAERLTGTQLRRGPRDDHRAARPRRPRPDDGDPHRRRRRAVQRGARLHLPQRGASRRASGVPARRRPGGPARTRRRGHRHQRAGLSGAGQAPRHDPQPSSSAKKRGSAARCATAPRCSTRKSRPARFAARSRSSSTTRSGSRSRSPPRSPRSAAWNSIAPASTSAWPSNAARAKAGRKVVSSDANDVTAYREILDANGRTVFTGYDEDESEATIVAILERADKTASRCSSTARRSTQRAAARSATRARSPRPPARSGSTTPPRRCQGLHRHIGRGHSKARSASARTATAAIDVARRNAIRAQPHRDPPAALGAARGAGRPRQAAGLPRRSRRTALRLQPLTVR